MNPNLKKIPPEQRKLLDTGFLLESSHRSQLPNINILHLIMSSSGVRRIQKVYLTERPSPLLLREHQPV